MACTVATSVLPRVALALTLGAALAAPGAPAVAASQSAVFTLSPLVINGSSNVSATAINDKGTIVGTVDGNGFALYGSTVKMLPGSNCANTVNCGPFPSVVTKNGDIAGIIYAVGFTFVLRDGKFLPGYKYGVDDGGWVYSLNNRGEIVFTQQDGIGAPFVPYIGTPPNIAALELTTLSTVRSVNDGNVAAGDGNICEVRGARHTCVYFGKNGKYVNLLPRGAIGTSGGYINDANQVAGTYADASGQQHGFVYHAGKYTSFDMPTTSLVGSISVSALSNTGRVVGVYTDAATNMLHVFWFNGTTVSYFGNYSSDGFPILAVALNDVNQAVVAFNAASAGVYTSSLVSCAGTAC